MARNNRDHQFRRGEPPARMTLPGEVSTVQQPAMKVAEEAPEILSTQPVQVDPDVSEMFSDGAIHASTGEYEMVNDPPGTFQEPDDGRQWQPMDGAFKDGSLIEAKAADGSEFMMVWRRTSRYNARICRWEQTGFWSSHMSREPIKVEPVGWRMPEGFSMPGAVVA